MRLNLPNSRLTSLSFRTTLELPRSLLDKLCQISPPDEDGDCVFVQTYAWGAGSAVVVPPKGSEATDSSVSSDLLFLFRKGKYVRPEPSPETIDKLVELLRQHELEARFDCFARFRYSSRARIRPVIDLPFQTGDSQALPFDAIEGIRVVSREGEQLRYSAVIDLDPEGGFRINLEFGVFAAVSPALGRSIIDLASDYASRLVRRIDS